MLETKQDVFEFLVNHTIEIAEQVPGVTKQASDDFREDIHDLWNNATSGRDCPYCSKGKPFVNNNVSFVGLEPEVKRLWFNSNKFVGHSEMDFVHIKYCPECGAKL